MIGWILIGVFIGVAITLMADAFLLFQTKRGRAILRRFLYRVDGIEFRKMPNPPDEGIEQLIYKPEGEAATISKDAISRHRDR